MTSPEINLIHGDCREVMKGLEPESFTALITDPPAGIGFMNVSWDSYKDYVPVTYKGNETHRLLSMLELAPWEVGFVSFTADWSFLALRLLKPGAYVLVWTLPRTSDLTAMGLRVAGYEIRDSIAHLFGQGMPKPFDVSKALDKAAGVEREVVGQRTDGRYQYGFSDGAEKAAGSQWADKQGFTGEIGLLTAPATELAQLWDDYHANLKPAREDWILARKPLSGTYVQNIQDHGVGALNIGGCRIDYQDEGDQESAKPQGRATSTSYAGSEPDAGRELGRGQFQPAALNGRWPANVMFDEAAAAMLDQQTGTLTSGTGAVKKATSNGHQGSVYGSENRPEGTPNVEYGDSGGASRFFYVSKAAPSEKNAGLEEKNDHPTVKSIDLMRYLIRLVRPPAGSRVLEPFAGTGTTAISAWLEDCDCVAIEHDPAVYEKTRARVDHWLAQGRQLGLFVPAAPVR